MADSCVVEDCDRDAHARNWCTLHYQRWKRHGAPTATAYVQRDPVCVVDGCERPQRRREYCGAHYARLLRHGDPLGGEVDRAASGQRCTEPDCARGARSHGRCNRHAKAHRAATDPSYVDRKRETNRDWYSRNYQAQQDRGRRYGAANRGRRIAQLAAWRAENPWYSSAYSFARRRRLYGLPDEVAEQVMPDDVYERDRGLCRLCREPVDRGLLFPHPGSMTLDHRTPVSDPASEHTLANVQLAHWECNRDRQDAPLSEATA